MTWIEEHGPITPGRGEHLVRLLRSRDGRLTRVTLTSGETLDVYDIASGRDLGAEWEHVTTNCSPPVEGRPIHSMTTSEIVRIEAPETGAVLFEHAGSKPARS